MPKKYHYKTLKRPDHPMAHADGLIREHRIVAAEKLGRPLSSDEHVHHINGDTMDNRSENLMIVTASEHAKIHAGTWGALELSDSKYRLYLRGARQELDLSQKDVARQVGISRTLLGFLETGERPLTDERYAAIVKAIFGLYDKRHQQILAAQEMIALKEHMPETHSLREPAAATV